ncbi:hypothetical protein POTOM_040852 [Populus tomentosa]|uniref:COP9 signalosome complex subunit 3 N-terminal helical repeats domain-containing protein n=1 Tax=Populus tomentosa TaxID=118781 RepID=A0A8X7YLH2_POPTO|nr:hypothetical protein POTOM_040852 [Populus tomentosa]
MEFHGGDKVEVCSEDEGFLGSYYVATTIKNLVEEEDMSKHLIETHHNPSAKTHRWSTLLNGLNLRTHPTPKPLTRPLKPSPPLLLIFFFFKPNPFLVDGVTISEACTSGPVTNEQVRRLVLILSRFLTCCVADQIRLASEKLIAVSKRFKDQVLMLEVPMRGVAPLLEAVKKLRSSSKHVTALHSDFLQLCLLAKGMICIGQKHFQKALELLHNAFSLLNESPKIQFGKTKPFRNCSSHRMQESVTDKEYVADNESVGDTNSQDAVVSSKKLTELSDDESETGNSQTGLMDVINNVKLTVVDMVANVSAYFKKIFSFSSAEHTPDAADENAGSSTTEHTLGASLMALAVMVIMVVVLRRP